MIKTVRAASLAAVVVLVSAAGLPTDLTATTTTTAPAAAPAVYTPTVDTASLEATLDSDTTTTADFVQPAPAQTSAPRALDEEGRCLAAAVYFEARGELPAGQLAVAEVILNRVASGRFASTICGVIKQARQFSFVHGGQYATPHGAAWASAQAVAAAALDADGRPTVGNATYFHATHVAPGWGLRRVAAIGNHVFYR